jgi:hypothetical protein
MGAMPAGNLQDDFGDIPTENSNGIIEPSPPKIPTG